MPGLDIAQSSSISDPLRRALLFVAAECTTLEDDWWIIGSTAAFLSGLFDPVPRDIDLLVSARDASRLFLQWNVQPRTPLQSNLFRSVFGICNTETIDIEIMGDLNVNVGREWCPLKLKSRKAIETDAGKLYIPTREEQVSILKLFGRPKDLIRAKSLETL